MEDHVKPHVKPGYLCISPRFNPLSLLYQETLQTVQQLESNLSNLRKWLAQMEHKLSTPIRYKHPDMAEIQKKLEEQKDIQKDIERHSAGRTCI